jgi:hypothetical protein
MCVSMSMCVCVRAHIHKCHLCVHKKKMYINTSEHICINMKLDVAHLYICIWVCVCARARAHTYGDMSARLAGHYSREVNWIR